MGLQAAHFTNKKAVPFRPEVAVNNINNISTLKYNLNCHFSINIFPQKYFLSWLLKTLKLKKTLTHNIMITRP